MIKSMTAFARSEKTVAQRSVSIEIRSYNSRFLDSVLRLSHGYQELEEKIKAQITETIARGRVEVKIQIVDEPEEMHAFEVNAAKARAYHNALVQLRDDFNLKSDIALDLISNVSGIITPVEPNRDVEACWPVVRECLNEALEDLVAMRKREGAFIAEDFKGRLGNIAACLEQVKEKSSNLLGHYQERLKERISMLTKGIVDIDPVRVAQEAAFLADRSDISEEIVRTESHLEHFRKIMNSAEPAGRKLNFLLQELNREVNTIGSKTENVDVAHIIVEVKSELEKIREQVQNIE